MIFDEETEQAIDEYIEEETEARREHDLLFWEGCTVVVAPTGAPPEYINVEVDGVNDPNVYWRGVPSTPAVGDELLVWENPITHRREIVAASGAGGVTGGGSWCQHVVVAKCGGDFTLPSQAITWINALPAGQVPAANRLYVIWVLAGNYAEGADVTVPQYVHVVGHGEGTEIEMGAFTLIMSSDSSITNVVVESTDPVDAIRVNIATNVILREVKAIQGAAAVCFHFTGNTEVVCYDCIAQATTGGATGFYFEDPAAGGLEDCSAESGNFTTAFRTASAKEVTTRFCRFVADTNDVLTAGGSDWNHFACSFDPANSSIAGGTHTAESTKRFNQTVIVAKAGGDFTLPSQAITWINALGDAAAGKRYGILVLAGNFAETGNITIPQHVHVAGMGEGSRIEMGAFTINMSDDSSLMDLTVTCTTGQAITINDADCELFNVHVISDGNYCVFISGDSDCELRHVVAETTSGCLFGFQVTNTANVMMYDCEADDATNFTTAALVVANTSCTCTTRYCTFHGDADDVWVGTAGTWEYCNDDFDYRNCTINGTARPADGQPIIWFDYTIAAAAAADITNAIDWVKGRTRVGDYTIDVAAGSYDVGLTFIDFPDEGGGNVILEGDTRALAGLSYVSGPQTAAAWAAVTPYVPGNIVQPTAPNNFYYKCQVGGNSGAAEPAWPTALNGTVVDGTVTWICCGIPNNRAGLANGGGQGAVCMITSAAFTLTVTMTTTPGGVASNPNFAADGWQNGDTLIAYDNAGATAVHTITGVAANVLTIGAGAPVLGNLGTAFTLIPNRAIARTGAGPCITNYTKGVRVDGWYLDTAAGADCDGVNVQSGLIELENVAIRAEDYGIILYNDGTVIGDSGALSFFECLVGASCSDGQGAFLDYAIAIDSTYGFIAQGGYMYCPYAIVSAGSYGYFASLSDMIVADYAYAISCSVGGFGAQYIASISAGYAVAEGCGSGFYANYLGGLYAGGAAARNCTTGYSSSYNSYIYAVATNANNAGNTANYSPAASDTEGNVYAIITFT